MVVTRAVLINPKYNHGQRNAQLQFSMDKHYCLRCIVEWAICDTALCIFRIYSFWVDISAQHAREHKLINDISLYARELSLTVAQAQYLSENELQKF